jgi:hypothetical protein
MKADLNRFQILDAYIETGNGRSRGVAGFHPTDAMGATGKDHCAQPAGVLGRESDNTYDRRCGGDHGETGSVM